MGYLQLAGGRKLTFSFSSPTTPLLFLLGGRRRGGNPRDFQGKRFQELRLVFDGSELKRPSPESFGCLSPSMPQREMHASGFPISVRESVGWVVGPAATWGEALGRAGEEQSLDAAQRLAGSEARLPEVMTMADVCVGFSVCQTRF